jgi:hypothetical protein
MIRDLALHRLLKAKECLAAAHCEESMLDQANRLLASHNPNERMEAVGWLGHLADLIGRCESMACPPTHFRRAPVRALLQRAVEDQNLSVGDEAFQYLATLDFHKKENAGYCLEIVPAMRRGQRYPRGTNHIIGGRLGAASIC